MVKFSGHKLIAVAALVVAVVTACRFMRYKNKVTWEQANQSCSEKSMQLATIPDCKFDSSLFNVSCGDSDAQNYWIGAHASTTGNSSNRQVDWIDGTGSVCSVKEMTGAENLCKNIQPGQCVGVNIQDGQENMHGSNCTSERGFVCESLPAAGKGKFDQNQIKSGNMIFHTLFQTLRGVVQKLSMDLRRTGLRDAPNDVRVFFLGDQCPRQHTLL